MRYRREIDGLRAVAVLPVILFHAGLPIFPGGFLGVDVFFVISGYLITTILLQDFEAGRYSVLGFYERRARRILPALFVVMAATIVVAPILMLPSQMAPMAESIAAVSFFVSNLYYLSQIDYFAPASELQPLLHTWSLAVEEQFYLVFPPVLAVLWRRGLRRTVWALSGVALASLVIAEIGAAQSADRNFFFTLSRVWELLAGALAAAALHHRSFAGRDMAAAPGLLMIAGSMLFLGRATAFPSLWTLVPVLGTVLVILFAGSGTVVARILGFRPLVGIGLISYSAYLWHHPLFAFARLSLIEARPVWLMLGLAALSLGLAYVTWRWVEQPFRRAERLPRRATLFAVAALVMVLSFGLGAAGRLTHGFDGLWRAAWPDKAAILDVIAAAKTEKNPLDDGTCRFNVSRVDEAVTERLLACSDQFGPGIAVLGDSHAVDLFSVIAADGQPFVAGFTEGGCRPDRADKECPYASFRAFVLENPGRMELVIFSISGRYLLVEDGAQWVEQKAALMAMPLKDPIPPMTLNPAAVELVTSLLKDYAALVPIVWLGPRIEPQVQLEWLVARGCDAGLEVRTGTEDNFVSLDKELKSNSPVPYLSQIDLLDLTFPRDFGGCDGLLWSDGDHFSALGERVMASRADLVAEARAALAQ